MTNENSLILTDCDGVLLQFEKPFRQWMTKKGFQLSNDYRSYYLHHHFNNLPSSDLSSLVNEFVTSDDFAQLPPLRDSKFYVNRLHQEFGFQFHVITSIGLDPKSKQLREENLKQVFGSAVSQVTCVDLAAGKEAALLPYINSNLTWIEDKWENYMTGKILGLNSILMRHSHNVERAHGPGNYVDTWRDIYNLITN